MANHLWNCQTIWCITSLDGLETFHDKLDLNILHENLKFPCEIIILLPTFISIRDIIGYKNRLCRGISPGPDIRVVSQGSKGPEQVCGSGICSGPLKPWLTTLMSGPGELPQQSRFF